MNAFEQGFTDKLAEAGITKEAEHPYLAKLEGLIRDAALKDFKTSKEWGKIELGSDLAGVGLGLGGGYLAGNTLSHLLGYQDDEEDEGKDTVLSLGGMALGGVVGHEPISAAIKNHIIKNMTSNKLAGAGITKGAGVGDRLTKALGTLGEGLVHPQAGPYLKGIGAAGAGAGGLIGFGLGDLKGQEDAQTKAYDLVERVLRDKVKDRARLNYNAVLPKGLLDASSVRGRLDRAENQSLGDSAGNIRDIIVEKLKSMIN